MAELEAIAEMLRRQRQDLEDLKEGTLSRRGQTAELVGKIEELRRRSEDTLRRFRIAAAEAASEEDDGAATPRGREGR